MGDFGNNVFGGSGLYSGVFEASPFISSISILNCATHTSCGEGTQSSPGGARIVPRNSPRSGAGARWGTQAFGPHPMPAPGSPEHPLVLCGHAVGELFTQVFFWGWKHLKKKKNQQGSFCEYFSFVLKLSMSLDFPASSQMPSQRLPQEQDVSFNHSSSGWPDPVRSHNPFLPSNKPFYSCSLFFFFFFSKKQNIKSFFRREEHPQHAHLLPQPAGKPC